MCKKIIPGEFVHAMTAGHYDFKFWSQLLNNGLGVSASLGFYHLPPLICERWIDQHDTHGEQGHIWTQLNNLSNSLQKFLYFILEHVLKELELGCDNPSVIIHQNCTCT